MEAAGKLFVDAPDVFRSKVVVRQRGAGGGPQGPGRAPPAARGGPAAAGRPCSLELASVRPFGSVNYFPKYCPLNVSRIFGASDVRNLDRYFSS